jgi:hypothetical protein
MREKAKIAGAVVIILLLVTANIQAEVITINLTAQITQLDDMDNLLLGQLGIGSTISGSYTYDSDAADLNPSPHYGGSIFTTVPYGINLAGGGMFLNPTLKIPILLSELGMMTTEMDT